MGAFLHFGLDTFDGTEQGDMAKDTAKTFAPTALTQDTVNAWVQQLQAAGFTHAMLTAKHSTGFCLWPSASTNYCDSFSVKQSNWMNGNGDLVRMWTDAMHAAGMKVGMYLSPWDQHHTSSKSDYQTYFEKQVTDLLTLYGSVYEIQFDGHSAPGTPGFPATVDWAHVYALARTLQPQVLIWAGPELANQSGAENPPSYPDLQWVGNENGQATRTTTSLDDTDLCGGGSNRWCAANSDVSDRQSDWFWHPTGTPISVSQMQSIYFDTIGMNSSLIFNVPPDQTGAFDPKDVTLLSQFGTWYSSVYKDDLVKGQPVTADSTWATAGFEAAKGIDGDICTYWAAGSGKTMGQLEVDPPSAITFTIISIREPIELGERSTGYHVEIKQSGNWTTPSDIYGTQVKGTVIGERQLWQLNKTPADAIRLVIDSARGVPAIAEFSVY